MAAGSGALNLSLLSRGVGEVKRNGSERVDVIFEPQDYFNFVEESQERPFFLPPLQPRYGFSDGSQVSSRPGPKEHVYLPKTFTTRKGALLLFSEDMAHKTKQEVAYKKHRTFDIQSKDRTLSTMTASSLDHDLKTVDDLAKSILAYGSIDETGKMNLKFLHQKRKYDFDRQIRPGFSAKRYLSTWTKNWDDNVLEKVISKGYLTEKSLFYYNPLLPHLSRRLNDDMSHYPTPYKLMRSMLMSPGSLSGYTFYRVRPESQETDYIEISDEDDGTQARSAGGRSAHDRSVKLLSVTADGGQKEISYGTLDARQQKEVLTDLLVKSAVHYALKKQQEYVLDANRIDEEGSEYNPMPKFDMKDAVETMLSDNDKKSVPANVIEADLPERDDRSQHSGSFKGSKLGHSARLHPAVKERGSSEALLSINTQDDAHIPTSPDALPPLPTGHSVLPPIGQTYTQLTPIGEASREHTTAFSLPVDKDEEEEEKWAGRNVTEKESHVPRPPKEPVEEKRRRDADKRKGTKIPQHSLDLDGPVITGGPHLMSSSESLGPGSTQSSALGWQHRQPQWKGSTQSLRSQGSRKASGSVVDGDVGSTKGSIVFGPDGAVIKVGETIKLSARASEGVQDVQDANMYPTGLRDASDDSDGELPDEWRQKRRADSVQRYGRKDSPKSHVTEQEIIDTLTSHASRIAESVLSQSDGGQVLEEDIRTMIHDVMKAQKRNSAGPTVAEYRDQIRGNLMTAIAKAAGIDQSEIPADAEIDPELMEQLSSQNLTPGDIEIVRDEETGRSFIRSRNRQISEAMGGVEKGHIYQSGGKGDANKRISIPERKQNVDIGELDVIKYGEADKLSQKSPSEKAGSEVGSKIGSVSGAQSLVAGSQHDDTVGSKTPKSAVSFKDDKQEADEFQKAIEDLERSSTKKSEADALSEKSDDKKSKVSEKGKKKEEFVVGKVKENKELELLYGQPDLPVKKETTGKPKAKPKAPVKPTKKPKKGKGKGKKKEEEVAPEPETAIEATSPVKEPTPEPVAPSEPPKEPTPPPPESEPSPEPEYESPKPEESEDEGDYIIVRDQSFSPEPESVTRANVTTSPEEEPEEEQEGLVSQDDIDEDMSEADKLRLISNREARAAKRAAAAEKRRQEVERKRREREEQLKKEKEEQERQEKLKVELEEQRKRKEEERRLRKQREEEENEAAIREEVEQQRRAAAEAEKERRRKEEYARKLEEMKKRQAEEEQKRREEAERKRLEEEERKRQEEELMAQMEEEERLEYERKRKEEEEERKRKEEEEKRLREEEAQRALEEARRLAEEMARRQAELEARLRFNRSLQLESNGLEHTQDITKAFVFSYFELLQWLGLDIPEFELLKLNQY